MQLKNLLLGAPIPLQPGCISALAVRVLVAETVQTTPPASLPATRQPGLGLETGRLEDRRHTWEVSPPAQDRQSRETPLVAECGTLIGPNP